MSEGGISSGLPEGWAWAALSDVADSTLGKMLDRKKGGEHPVSYLRNVNVQWGRIDMEDILAMSIPPEQQEFFRVRKGDLLVCEGGEVGRCAVFNGDGTGYLAFQKALHRVRPLGGISSLYFRYYLEYLHVTGGFSKFATGSTIKHLPQQQLKRLPVRVPPLEEQRRIVAALEEQLSRLGAAEGNAAEVRRKLLAYKASRELEVVPSPHTVEQELAEGWRIVRLSDISHSSGYGTSTKCDYDGAGTAVLRIPNIQGGVINSADLKYAVDADLNLDAHKVRAGDLLVVRTNGSRDLIGRVAVSSEDTDYAFASYLIRFRIKTEDAYPNWVAKILSTRPWRRLIEAAAASTAGQYNLNLKKLGLLPIPLPPLEQQRLLTAALDEIDESVRRLTSAVKDASLKGGALRRSILIKAFAGRLVSQDPSDEPADALLARIRAEREAAGATNSRRRSPRRTPAQRKRAPHATPALDAPPPPPTDVPALATATQPTLDLEIPS
ncbi:restriction endonuclease subunit S [Streptomyces adelaidensis]|uniref:restriction endonuclease subunit S n=1 Tax=Streptomyces adelaidensis TaxID=2796465 RepID=UPI0019060AA1|nr:restriction endonuclease subunit S [Streptomyces adelaidensis]